MSSTNTTRADREEPTEGLGAIGACTGLAMLACVISLIAISPLVLGAATAVSLSAAIVGGKYARLTTGNHREQ